MVLNDVKLTEYDGAFNIRIDGCRISSVSKASVGANNHSIRLNLGGACAFPGLINSHDHLDFDLFPQLGNNIYTDYLEWGNYIHGHYKQQINAVLAVPVALRVKWGMYKNLINGVTTVANHGEHFKIDKPLITMVDQCQNLHSVKLEKRLKLRLNNPLKLTTPAVIHIGEGTNDAAAAEINELLRWNLLHRQLIGVHAVAMDENQANYFKALVWCPESNFYLLGKTAAMNKLKERSMILFGTDSTLTGSWDIWQHIRRARKAGLLNDGELFRSLTSNAADIWKMNSGRIEPKRDADILIVKPKNDKEGLPAFYNTRPEDILMVIHQGNIRMFDEVLLDQLDDADIDGFCRIRVNQSTKYVQGDVAGLINEIRRYYPDAEIPVRTNQLINAH